MIERWSERVKKGDRVYHLGDFALGRPEDAAAIASRLDGKFSSSVGTTRRSPSTSSASAGLVWVKDYFGLKVGEQKIYLCHYAFRTWNQMHYGSWHLHGHSHGTLEDLETSKSFDVGVDCWNFAPISFEEVAAKMATKRFEPVDHHIDELD